MAITKTLAIFFSIHLIAAQDTTVLPFLELSDDAEEFTGVDDASVEFDFPMPFYFNDTAHYFAFITSNGLVSFGLTGYNDFTPEPFPLDALQVISPYWNDIDLRRGSGIVYFESYTSASDSLPDATVLQTISDFITNSQNLSKAFECKSAVIIYWSNVCPYGRECGLNTNSFQAVLASNDKTSYVIFTYKCGSLNWVNHGHGAGIGYSAGKDSYENHYLSQQNNVNDIACLNQPSSPWNNVVYKVNEDDSICIDIICHNGGICVGNGSCICTGGWAGPTCQTAECVPECANNGNCIRPGQCQCIEEWTGERCREDIDECLNISVCGETLCNNTPGSYNCYCKDTLQINPDLLICEDSDECEDANGGCSQVCNNIYDGYHCSCGTGYELGRDNHTCQDIDECSTGRAQCRQHCNNTIGGFYCYCDDGFTLDINDNRTCSDIDECLLGVDSCSSITEICINTLGHFTCICKDGYFKTNPMDTCEDIDECNDSNGGCSHICVNMNGSHLCTCPDGFIFQEASNRYCIDINECANSSLNTCEHVCINTRGGFSCDCSEGFTLLGDSECKADFCNYNLTSPNNGSLYCNSTLQVTHTQCNISCHVGFDLIGSETVICQPDGSWSGEPAYCTLSKCPQLSPPTNGYIQLPCPGLYGDTCNGTCFEGFSMTSNSNSSTTCDIQSTDDGLNWAPPFSPCEKQHPCDITPCRHGGKCIRKRDEYECNCTGTLYEGRNCEKGIIVFEGLREISSSKMSAQFPVMIRANLNAAIIINFENCIPVPFGRLPFGPVLFTQCMVNVPDPFEIVTLSPIPGLYDFPLVISGDSEQDFTPQPPLTIVVTSPEPSPYFMKFGIDSSSLVSSCCKPNITSEPRITYDGKILSFRSSCGWTSTAQGGLQTAGIVFAGSTSFFLPLSVSGLAISSNKILTRPNLNSAECEECMGTDGPLVSLQNFSVQSSVCKEKGYMHKPMITNIKEFASRQFLHKTFLITVQDELLPTWIELGVSNTKDSIVESDIVNNITKIDESGVYSDANCPQMIVDTTGYFIFALINSPLNLALKSSDQTFKQYNLSTPASSRYYCIAVNLIPVQGQSSPVYIGVQPSDFSVQSAIQTISFISRYLKRGWEIEFSSFAFRKSSGAHQPTTESYWNGYKTDYNPLMSAYDVVANVDFQGDFRYINTSVAIDFLGQVYYKYILNEGEETVAHFTGKHALVIGGEIQGLVENIQLDSQDSTAFLYHKEGSSKCTNERTDGISWKLEYKPRLNQMFFTSVVSPLPGDSACVVDVFMNLDFNKEMDGLSFHSNCLQVSYDSLLFSGNQFSHKFYFPSNDSSQCTTSTLALKFPGYQNFGLLVQSSLSEATKLGQYFLLSPQGSDSALEIVFSKSSLTKAGLLQSVDITILDNTLQSDITIINNELSFNGSLNMYNEPLYHATITGKASTESTWEALSLTIDGCLGDPFKGMLETAVHDYLTQATIRFHDRVNRSNDQFKESSEEFNELKKELENILAESELEERRYNGSIASQTEAEMSISNAEALILNATGELRDAEVALQNLCQIETCKSVCAPVTRERIVFEDLQYFSMQLSRVHQPVI